MKSYISSLPAVFASVLLIPASAVWVGCSSTPPKPSISEAAFETEINSGDLVLVKFGAQWCGPCRLVDQELEKLSEQGDFSARVIEVDIDSNRNLARRYKVGGIPHMILVRSNEVLDQQVGYMTAEELEDWVKLHTSNDAETTEG